MSQPYSFRQVSAAALLLGGLLPAAVTAEPTALRILARADDAKYIGSGVGGLQVSVRDADSGALLGGGEIGGGTGDTDALMTRGQRRGADPVDDDSASLTLELDIRAPARIEVSATGPGDFPQSRQRASQTLWLLPGQHRVATPLVLELQGLLLDLVEHRIRGRRISLTAQVAMLCGCPITADGLWAADDFAVSAQLRAGGRTLLEQPLLFSGEASRFAGTLLAPDSGPLELLLQAVQHSTGNAAVYRLPLQL